MQCLTVAKCLLTNQVPQWCLSGLALLGPASQREAVHMGKAEVSSPSCRILVEEYHLRVIFASLTGSRWLVNVLSRLWKCRSVSQKLLFSFLILPGVWICI